LLFPFSLQLCLCLCLCLLRQSLFLLRLFYLLRIDTQSGEGATRIFPLPQIIHKLAVRLV
jgi:hypothetical protein